MRKSLSWLQSLFCKPSPPTETQVALAMISMTHEQELSCDEVHDLIDQFAEMQLRGENSAHLFLWYSVTLKCAPNVGRNLMHC